MGQKSRNKRRRIVKVQLSLATNIQFDASVPVLMRRQMLMYDKSRQWHFEGPVNAETVALMGDSVKKYFWAVKEGPIVRIDHNVPCDQNQGW